MARAHGITDPIVPKGQRMQLWDVLKGSRDGTGTGIIDPVVLKVQRVQL